MRDVHTSPPAAAFWLAVAVVCGAVIGATYETTRHASNHTQDALSEARAACAAAEGWKSSDDPGQMLFTIKSDSASAAAGDPRWQVLAGDVHSYQVSQSLSQADNEASATAAWDRLMADCKVVDAQNP